MAAALNFASLFFIVVNMYAKASFHSQNSMEIMQSARSLFVSVPASMPFSIFDRQSSNSTRKEFDDCLSKIEKGMEAGTLTKSDLADCIISIEFCEWNDAFAYILTTMKNSDAKFRTAAINIHKHKMAIERFLNSCNEFKKHLDRITHFPDIWEEKILIVDDEQVIIDVMQAILSKEGMIETAANGKEALEKVQEKYYAAIISDVNMPVMDGIDFYKRAVELYPSISKRFLFFTGRVVWKQTDFFREHNLPYLQKPSHLKEIKNKVIGILSAS